MKTTSSPPSPLTPGAIDLDGLLQRLHLPTIRRLYLEMENRAEAQGMNYRDYLAIQNGYDACFATAAELIDELSSAAGKAQLRKALAGVRHAVRSEPAATGPVQRGNNRTAAAERRRANKR